MTHASLFSGIGGFDLAAEWAGWTNVFNTEIDPFCRRVLAYHFPKSTQYQDIKKTNYEKYKGKIDVLTGGFPCQPFSVAGKRRGTEDDRYLWHHMLRAICEIRPTYVVAENVRGLLSQDKGVVFEQVCVDLEDQGYEVVPCILPAAGVNAPHRRDRVWIVAYTHQDANSRESRKHAKEGKKKWLQKRNKVQQFTQSDCLWNITDPLSQRWFSRGSNRQKRPICNYQNRNATQDNTARCGWICRLSEAGKDKYVAYTHGTSQPRKCKYGQRKKKSDRRSVKDARSDWRDFPAKPPVCGGNDGLPRELDAITFPRWRTESVKAYGNAIVPQVAIQIFKAINQLKKEL